MSPTYQMVLGELVKKHERELLQDWVREQLQSVNLRRDLIDESQLREDSSNFLRLFQEALQNGNPTDIQSTEWQPVREFLEDLSRSRARKGFSPTETATFVFSFKQILFSRIRRDFEANPNQLVDQIWISTVVLDKLGLLTNEVYQKSREEVVKRQQEEMLELSTPVVKLWDGILALPMIGTLDSMRTQIVMETLLQRIVETGSEIAIIDITGVPTVDTLVAQHLLKTVTAARLMGAECIISGIRPQIASTIVHLGVELGNIVTKANLAEAFAVALSRLGRTVISCNSSNNPATHSGLHANLKQVG